MIETEKEEHSRKADKTVVPEEMNKETQSKLSGKARLTKKYNQVNMTGETKQVNETEKRDQPQEAGHLDEEDESRVPQKTSLLFERYAVWGMLVFLILSIWFQVSPYIILSVFLIILYVLLIWWKKKSLQKVDSTIHLEKSHIFAGESTRLLAAVSNNKWLPLVWLEVELNKTNGLKWEQARDRYVMRILWLLWYQKVEWDIDILAEQRGVYALGQTIVLRSGDGFRFTEVEKEILGYGAELYVYPKLVPVKVPSLALVSQWGADGRKGGIHEDPLLIRGVREYQHGDEWKRINWQATARTGKLQISEYERMLPKNLIFYIDVQGFNVPEKKQEFEWFLSVIASMAVAYDNQGVKLQYGINGVNHKNQGIAYSGHSASITAFLEKMASVTAVSATKNKLLSMLSAEAPLFIFCSSVRQDHLNYVKQHNNKPILVLYLNESSLAVQLGSKGRHLQSVMTV
ncbi:DUF58 domain-containing protein [Bacillus sp. Marseille-P3661]|uniref:DUF58 domain-containing protein n=1 Tax=Bacillus sp. Marseille-P3661 TaxID=1936234 RepID=UPI000C840D7E|nr:DUF58 domain-containing protein [Bacillus sp. Marseille-P3661]